MPNNQERPKRYTQEFKKEVLEAVRKTKELVAWRKKYEGKDEDVVDALFYDRNLGNQVLIALYEIGDSSEFAIERKLIEEGAGFKDVPGAVDRLLEVELVDTNDEGLVLLSAPGESYAKFIIESEG